MARSVSILVCGALASIAIPVAAADELSAFGYSPSGSANFSDALGPEALARELALNAAPASDLLKSFRRKAGNVTTKATVSIFGSISNTLGQPLCALVL